MTDCRRAVRKGAPTGKPQPCSVGRIVGAIKSRAVCLARARGLPAASLWQRGYYDHIIRGEEDFLRIWTYLDNNPQKWELDRYYTQT